MDESKVIEGEWHEIEADEDDEITEIEEAEDEISEDEISEDSEPEYPIWYDGKHLDEVKFCDAFLREHPMICVRGEFFTVDGSVGDEDEITQPLKAYCSAMWRTYR